MKFLRVTILTITALLLLVSCEGFRSNWHNSDRKVAKVGKDVLYESDILPLLPDGISSEDSAAMVRQYVNTWALSRLKVKKAEEQLSKSEKDVSAQVEEYRNNLIGFRYEKLFIEERIDTVVTEQEIENYYKEHKESFITSSSVVKARVVHLASKSSYYSMIRDMLDVTSPEDVSSLEELCFFSADRYNDFGKDWTDISTFAREVGSDAESLEADIRRGDYFTREIDGSTVMVQIMEKVVAGEVSPLEFNKSRIKETLISRRKQELLSTLERDLLEEAAGNNTLKIYSYDE